MKKFALLLGLALPLAFTSCSNDEEPSSLTLDKTSVTINYGENVTISASEKNVTWTSGNDFVATVENGKIVGAHAGSTTITVTKDGKTAYCNVTVKTTNDNFDTIIDWGLTPSQVKDYMPNTLTLLIEEPGELLYTLDNEAFPWFGFLFDANDKLEGSSIYFTDAQFDEYDFNGYLNQRYTKLGTEDEGTLYADAYTRANANIAVIVNYDAEEDVWTANWMPMTHVGTKALGNDIVKRAKALYKAGKNK